MIALQNHKTLFDRAKDFFKHLLPYIMSNRIKRTCMKMENKRNRDITFYYYVQPIECHLIIIMGLNDYKFLKLYFAPL